MLHERTDKRGGTPQAIDVLLERRIQIQLLVERHHVLTALPVFAQVTPTGRLFFVKLHQIVIELEAAIPLFTTFIFLFFARALSPFLIIDFGPYIRMSQQRAQGFVVHHYNFLFVLVPLYLPREKLA